jgi:hypothetical protein
MVAFEARADGFERHTVAEPVHDDVAAVGGEAAGSRQAEAAGGSGDQRTLACQGPIHQ